MLSSRSLAAAAGSALLAVTLAATAADLGKAAPGQAGFSASRLSRIDAVVTTAIADRQIAGAVVAVARDNKLVYLKSFGKSDAESGRAMTDDTIFRIASMTKPITSVAVMMLQEEGKLLISDPLSKYIPEFKDAKVLVAKDPADPAKGFDTVPAKRAVTLQDLLSHTSGISYRFWGGPTSPMYEQAGASDGLEPTAGTIAEGAKKMATVPLVSQPGERFEYGLNTDILGRVVEVASGMPLDRFFAERIFRPLGMKDTQFYLADGQKGRLASLYIPDGKGGIAKAGNDPIRWGALAFSAGVPTSATRTYFSGGGGLSSTAHDYLRFTQMLLNGGVLDGARLLGPKSVELMRTNAIGKVSVWDSYAPAAIGNLGDKFGLGFGIKSEAGQNELGSVGEYMWAGIFNTRFWIDPKERLSIVVLAQQIPRVPDVEAKVHAAVYQAILR